jgi:hypothetical protein
MIIRSLTMLGEKVPGGTLTSAEQTAYLAVLNTMLESWTTERLLIYEIIEEAFALIIGSSAYTIGSGGNFNTTRPVKLEDTCFINYLSHIYQVNILSERNFSALQTVGLSGMPRNLYFDISLPLATIYFDYKPDITYDFHLKSLKQLQTFAAITDTVSLPLGYQRAIESNLAMELAPGLTSVSPETARIAKESKAAVRTLNAPESVLRLDLGVAGHRRFDIMTGI